jgi:transposase
MSRLFWLSDVQGAAIQPHLPMVHTGPRRVDDRRVISGIVHRFREGCRWRPLRNVLLNGRWADSLRLVTATAEA